MMLRNTLIVIVCVVLWEALTLAQPEEKHEDVRLKAGLTTGIYARRGESFEGTYGALGGWATVMLSRWGFDIDFSRGRRTQERGSTCIDRSCATIASGTSVERNSTIGITALRQIGTPGRAMPHLLVGFGTISRQTAYRFDDASLGSRSQSTSWAAGPVAGAGMDISANHYVVRVQYRVNFRVEHSIHQFQLGLGWAN
jgi:hypothetical protein